MYLMGGLPPMAVQGDTGSGDVDKTAPVQLDDEKYCTPAEHEVFLKVPEPVGSQPPSWIDTSSATVQALSEYVLVKMKSARATVVTLSGGGGEPAHE